jgi:hypothetical protein
MREFVLGSKNRPTIGLLDYEFDTGANPMVGGIFRQ